MGGFKQVKQVNCFFGEKLSFIWRAEGMGGEMFMHEGDPRGGFPPGTMPNWEKNENGTVYKCQ